MDLNIKRVDRESVMELRGDALQLGITLRELCIRKLGIKDQRLEVQSDTERTSTAVAGGDKSPDRSREIDLGQRPANSRRPDLGTSTEVPSGSLDNGSGDRAAKNCRGCGEPMKVVKGKWVCGDDFCWMVSKDQGSAE